MGQLPVRPEEPTHEALLTTRAVRKGQKTYAEGDPHCGTSLFQLRYRSTCRQSFQRLETLSKTIAPVQNGKRRHRKIPEPNMAWNIRIQPSDRLWKPTIRRVILSGSAERLTVGRIRCPDHAGKRGDKPHYADRPAVIGEVQ